MSKDVISWVNAALIRKDRVSLVMDWRRKLYHSEFDKINLALQLRQSDEKNNVQDIYCIDASDELSDGQVMSLFSFWMFHGRSQNLYGGSTWLNSKYKNQLLFLYLLLIFFINALLTCSFISCTCIFFFFFLCPVV